MHIAGHYYEVMAPDELGCIYSSALRILSTMGMEIQNQSLLTALADFGLPVDLPTERVRFPHTIVERYLAEVEKKDWAAHRPVVHGSAGVYHGRYHDPLSDALVPWTEERLASYFALARRLPGIGRAHMLGCRLDVPASLEPLYERYYCWKHGASDSGTIQVDALCPYILDLYQAWADEYDVPLQKAFRGTVYLVPALKLGRHEAYQVAYFRERGLRVGIGDMLAAGGTAPATLAGAVTLNLAEQLALGMLNWAWFGDKHLSIGASVSVMDMRTWFYPYGRPEMAIANVMSAQIARWLGVGCSGHAGLSDAPLPSPEACAQKALTAIPTFLAGGALSMDAGLLAVDEVCSPIQMVLDHEFMRALARLAYEFEVSEESIGLDTILSLGPGGQYADQMHTVQHFRGEHWEPSLWTRQPLGHWLEGNRSLDIDHAREMALDLGKPPEEPFMSANLEQNVLQVIEAARKG